MSLYFNYSLFLVFSIAISINTGFKNHVKNNSLNQLENSLNSDCIFSTKGIEKAQGLNIKLHYPCSWKAKEDKQLLPIRVKSFSNEVLTDYRLGVSLDVEKYSDSLTEEDINRFRTKDFQEIVLLGSDQTLINLTQTKINGIEADQVTSVLKSKTEFSKFFLTHLYYKGFIITISFVTNVTHKSELESSFKKYKPIFTTLANSTTIEDFK